MNTPLALIIFLLLCILLSLAVTNDRLAQIQIQQLGGSIIK